MKPAAFFFSIRCEGWMALAFGIALVGPQVFAAPTFTVNSAVDVVASAPLNNGVCETSPGNGICTLRAAVMKANHYPGGGVTIIIPAATCSLTIPPTGPDDELSGDLNINAAMTIQGASAATTIIDANQIDRVINIATGATVTISNLTIRNGFCLGVGGGIANTGSLTLNNAVVSGNQNFNGNAGGGIVNLGTTASTFNNTVISGNLSRGSGGGVFSDTNVTLTLNNCTVSGNTTRNGSYGGGIGNAGTMNLNNCLVGNNYTTSQTLDPQAAFGGGIANFSGVLTISNSTISNNSAYGGGGGIYNGGPGTINTYFVTLAGNLADNTAVGGKIGGGIYNASGIVSLKTTIIGQNYSFISLDDLAGTIRSQDYNLIQTIGLGIITGATSHNITGSDPLLESLQNNGGATQTRALFDNSPALDAVPTAQCTDQFGAPLAVDQRGSIRPNGSGCDMGAYEGSKSTSPYGRNLVRNGDADSSAGSPIGAFVGLPYWAIAEGTLTTVPYNSPGGFPNTATDTIPATHGFGFFAGGTSANSSATQSFNLTAIQPDIDAGKVNYTLSGDLGGFSSQTDLALLEVDFLDGSSAYIDRALIGPVTAADRNNATGLLHRTETGTVPVGTRTMLFIIAAGASQGFNDGYADNFSLVLTAPPTLGNISARLPVQTGNNVLIAGFIVSGTQPKKVIVRGIGPSLPLAGVLANPTLELHDSSTLLESNDDWVNSPNKQAIIDSTIPPGNNLESAIVRTLPANGAGYTAILRGVNGGTGIGSVEVYDLDSNAASKLANVSTRGVVQTGNNVLIGGTIVVGQDSQKVIVRAIGPSLPLAGKLADPTLELHDGNGTLLESNDNWVDSPNKQAIIDSTIPPTNDLESAIVRTLAPGAYTAIVRGVNHTTGIALVEVYVLN